MRRLDYREQSFELVDYDVFDDHDEENIFFMWEGLSARLKKYFDKCLPDEKQKFLDRIQEWQDRIDAEAKQQPKSHSADLEECDCAERSWYGKEHDSACPLAGQPNPNSLLKE